MEECILYLVDHRWGFYVRVVVLACPVHTVIHTADARQRYLNYVSSRVRTVLRVSQENDARVPDTVHATLSRNADSTDTHCIGICATGLESPISWCVRDGACGFDKSTFLSP